jgi:hypothetical protein
MDLSVVVSVQLAASASGDQLGLHEAQQTNFCIFLLKHGELY